MPIAIHSICQSFNPMQEAKNTARALVRIGYDGTVHKTFRAANAQERFDNELRVLQYLEERGCEFVPRVIDSDREKLLLITSNCGQRVQQISEEKLKSLFTELESYGVRHDDPYDRNVTYRASDGRFCIIDFEFATILDEEAAAQALTSTTAGVDTPAVPGSRRLLRWSGRTDVGKVRPNNEDRFLAVAFNQMEFNYLPKSGEVTVKDFDFIFAVSDGMGGERSGEFASRCALDNLTRSMPRRYSMPMGRSMSGLWDCLEEVFLGTHRQLTTLSASYEEGRNMGQH
ncbi:MAG: hypothetical protein R3B90_09670 [Planctomycetaceae bacterium]